MEPAGKSSTCFGAAGPGALEVSSAKRASPRAINALLGKGSPRLHLFSVLISLESETDRFSKAQTWHSPLGWPLVLPVLLVAVMHQAVMFLAGPRPILDIDRNSFSFTSRSQPPSGTAQMWCSSATHPA